MHWEETPTDPSPIMATAQPGASVRAGRQRTLAEPRLRLPHRLRPKPE